MGFRRREQPSLTFQNSVRHLDNESVGKKLGSYLTDVGEGPLFLSNLGVLADNRIGQSRRTGNSGPTMDQNFIGRRKLSAEIEEEANFIGLRAVFGGAVNVIKIRKDGASLGEIRLDPALIPTFLFKMSVVDADDFGKRRSCEHINFVKARDGDVQKFDHWI